MKKQKDPRRVWCSKEDAVSEVEAQMLLDASKDQLDWLVVGLPLWCGLRIGEVQHTKATWLDWDRGVIRIPARQHCECYECGKWRGRIWTPKSKAGVRELLIDPRLEGALRSMGTGINRCRQGLEQRFARIVERSGIHRKCYPHCLRATYATRLAEQGLSAPSLCYVMGWGKLTAADSYIQSSRTRAHAELRELAIVQKGHSA